MYPARMLLHQCSSCCLYRNLALAAEAARGIFFKARLVALAEQVVGSLDPHGRGFNGLHLRLEKDARDWHRMAGGTKVLFFLQLQYPITSACRQERKLQTANKRAHQ